jgi:hypothetical protein
VQVDAFGRTPQAINLLRRDIPLADIDEASREPTPAAGNQGRYRGHCVDTDARAAFVSVVLFGWSVSDHTDHRTRHAC